MSVDPSEMSTVLASFNTAFRENLNEVSMKLNSITEAVGQLLGGLDDLSLTVDFSGEAGLKHTLGQDNIQKITEGVIPSITQKVSDLLAENDKPFRAGTG